MTRPLTINTWPCGTPRSSNNAFCLDALPPRPVPSAEALRQRKRDEAKRAKRGRKPIDLAPRKGSITIIPSNVARTTRIMRAGI